MSSHLLLVEDDHAIRTVLQDALQRDGHQVTSAQDGDEAQALPAPACIRPAACST